MSMLNRVASDPYRQPITYLIGAGASHGAFPVVGNMAEGVSTVIGHLTSDYHRLTKEGNRVAPEEIRQVIFKMEELRQICDEHNSIDEYARILFIRNDEKEYLRLKNSIIVFFELYNYYTKKVDKRYSHFLAGVLGRSKLNLPNHINIVSWNYDYEFEKAFAKYYSPKEEFEDIYTELKTSHKGVSNTESAEHLPRLLKVNGTIGYTTGTGVKLGVGNFFNKSPQQRELENKEVTPLLHKFKMLSNSLEYSPMLSFSWEDDKGGNIIDQAVKVMQSTRILVVIGYSFPFFNRDVDELFLKDWNLQNIDRIYVQDSNPDKIIAKIKEFSIYWNQYNTEFVPVRDLDQFYMPHQHT